MQQVWKNRWRRTAWIMLGIGTIVLLGAAMYKKNSKLCQGITIVFNGDGSNYFIEESDVMKILNTGGRVLGSEISKVNLKLLEARLEQDRWINNAELFFDNKQHLQVRIEEKEPVARIFSAGGSSFYIDSMCRKLPLSDNLSARIPMVTNFPSDRQILSKPDSQLLAEVKDLAMFVQADNFWKAQVAQIDITPNGFEIIPTIGNHVIVLGKGGDYQNKFDRLFSFYKQVWTKVGLEKYERLDVQYDGQVVATGKGSKPAMADTAKAIQLMNGVTAPEGVSQDTLEDNRPASAGKPDTLSNSKIAGKPVVEKKATPGVVKAVAKEMPSDKGRTPAQQKGVMKTGSAIESKKEPEKQKSANALKKGNAPEKPKALMTKQHK